MGLSIRGRSVGKTVAWLCVALGIGASALCADLFHSYGVEEERRIDEERKRLVVSRPYVGALGTLGLIAIAIPVLVLGGDAGAEKLHEQGTDLAAFREKEDRLAREDNAERWSRYWSSVPADRTQLVALECRDPKPASPEQCLTSTSEALQPDWERARRNQRDALWGAAGGGGLILAGAIGALLFRRRAGSTPA